MRIVCLILGVACLAVSLLIAVMNWQPVPISLPGAGLSMPLGSLPLVGLVAGLLLLGSVVLSRKASAEANKSIQSDWQAQDAKLIASVKSDREKQLEAKIATLEAALKQALKKGS